MTTEANNPISNSEAALSTVGGAKTMSCRFTYNNDDAKANGNKVRLVCLSTSLMSCSNIGRTYAHIYPTFPLIV